MEKIMNTNWIEVYSIREIIEYGQQECENNKINANNQELKAFSQWQFLNELLNIQSNQEYKKLITETQNIIKEISQITDILVQDQKNENQLLDKIVDEFNHSILNNYLDQKKNRSNSIIVQLLILWVFYLRENQYGPSVYTLIVEDELKPIDHYGPLPPFQFDNISNKNKILQNQLLQYLNLNGEIFYERMQFLIIFKLIENLQQVLQAEVSASDENIELQYFNYLWLARHSWSHNQSLEQNVDGLQDKILKNYKKAIKISKQHISKSDFKDEAKQLKLKQNLSMLLSEYSHALIQFWNYEECEEAINEAINLLGISINLDGKLGRRTKWQSFDVAQLILDVKTQTVEIKKLRDLNTDNQGLNGELSSQYAKQNEESILWEQPKITELLKEDIQKIESMDLRVEDQIAIQAYVNYLFKSLPAKEESSFELIRVYVSSCVQKKNNWLVFSKALLFRSRNEIDRSKTMDRSLEQGQILIDQFRLDQKTPSLEKIDLSFATCYPMQWGVILELAQNYQKLGVFMSAHELLKLIGIYEDSIRCLFMAGRQTQAIEMADEYMKNNSTQNYNLMCLVGEMKRDYTWFEKAWEQSGHKCSKAMRMLGRYYFFENKFEKSIECYDQSLEINRLQPDVWFTKGCAHMRIEDFKNAIFAFGSVIQIDDRKIEAWANLANCYTITKKYFEAVTCCEQALKCNNKSWKIWNNYILFSIETLQFYKAAQGINCLLRNDQLDNVNSTLLLKISDCFIKRYVNNQLHDDDPDRHLEINQVQQISLQEFNRHKVQLYKLFDQVTEKINDYKIWRLIGKMKLNLSEPLSVVKEIKFKELRSLMKLNWHVDLQLVELVEKTLLELIQEIFEKAAPGSKDSATAEEIQFVKNTAKVIKESLHRECKFQI